MLSIDALFPKRRYSWVVWVLLLILVLPVYYTIAPYPSLAKYFHRPDVEENSLLTGKYCPSGQTDNDCLLQLEVLPLKYIADFYESPLIVTVENISTRTLTVTINLVLEPEDEEKAGARIMLGDAEQSSATLENVPPHGVRTLTFMVRTWIGSSDVPLYTLRVYVNNEFLLRRRIRVEFNRTAVFRFWVIEHLLLPPGSNIVIPVGLLLLVSLGESVFEASISRETLKTRLFYDRKWKSAAVLLVLLLLSIIGFLYVCWVWPEVVASVLVMTLVTVLIGWWLGQEHIKSQPQTTDNSHSDASQTEQ